jgi:hypothetical protein
MRERVGPDGEMSETQPEMQVPDFFMSRLRRSRYQWVVDQ